MLSRVEPGGLGADVSRLTRLRRNRQLVVQTAMILAAGRGERMLPLTRSLPKPLLEAGGRALIDYHLARLEASGVSDVVINVSHLGALIERHCGDGRRWNLRIHYSREAKPLETAGGIVRALPLLGSEPFLVINGDIWTDYPFVELLSRSMGPERAHLVLVDNPQHHPEGDFRLGPGEFLRARGEGERGLTYAGVALFRPEFFTGTGEGVKPLRPLLDSAIDARRITGEHYRGAWTDVGTPQRLAELDLSLRG